MKFSDQPFVPLLLGADPGKVFHNGLPMAEACPCLDAIRQGRSA